MVSEVMFSLNAAAISSSVYDPIDTGAFSAAKLWFAVKALRLFQPFPCPSYDLDAFWYSQAQATSYISPESFTSGQSRKTLVLVFAFVEGDNGFENMIKK